MICSPFSAHESHHRLAIVGPLCPNLMGVRPFGPHVRSLLYLSSRLDCSLPTDTSFLFNGLKLLNVLNLESVLDFLPSGVSHLILLTYLAVKGTFQSIPSSIRSLWKLETLVVNAPLSCIPDAILGMIKLKHLHIQSSGATLASLNENKAFNLHSVQTISTVFINSSRDMRVLRCFQDLREIKCCFRETQIGSKYWFPVLDFLIHLEVLHIWYSEIWREPESKAATLRLPRSLKQLTLSQFHLPWKQMSELAKSLPKLEVLKLVENALEGEECDMDIDEVELPELKSFKFKGLDIHKWNLSCSADAFSKLERLVIKDCKNLKKIPSSFAENNRLCLIELEGCNTSAEESALESKEEQLDYGNDKFEVLIRLSDKK